MPYSLASKTSIPLIGNNISNSNNVSNTEIYNKIINIKSKINNNTRLSVSPNPSNNINSIKNKYSCSTGSINEPKIDSINTSTNAINTSGFDQFNKNNKVLLTTVKDLKNRIQKSNNLTATKTEKNDERNDRNERSENQLKLAEIKNKLQANNKILGTTLGKKR